MQAIIDYLSQSWLGTAVGLIGICIALIIYRKSRNRAIPAYVTTGIRLIGSHREAMPDGVSVLYRSKKVPRLTKSYLIFWNAGNVTIRGEDIVNEDRIRVETSKNTQILSASVLKVTRSVNGSDVSIDRTKKNVALLNFNFLDKNDGIIAELLHTDKDRHLTVQGTIKGIPKGIINLGVMPPTKSSISLPSIFYKRKQLSWFALIFSIIVTTIGIINILLAQKNRGHPDDFWWILTVTGIVYLILACLIFWVFRRKYPKELHIDELE